MSGTRVAAVFVGLAAPLGIMGLLALACGSRTGLLVPVSESPEGSVVLPESDAPSAADTAPDVVPRLDARPLRDARQELCADASDTLIYVVTESNALLRFDPSSSTFSLIGKLVCPDSRNPFSMAVDRKGIAYVLYAEYPGPPGSPPKPPGSLYRVSLDTAACIPTTFQPGQAGFTSFGMGFSADIVGVGETLYVASDEQPSGRLGAIDPTSLVLSPVGTFSPPVIGAELTGTGDGRLYAFYAQSTPSSPGSTVVEIDKATAQVLGSAQLPTVTQGQGWAFAFWGGDFYLFTAPKTGSKVTRYDPNAGTLADVASYGEVIVGAGVSTCAPVQ